MSGPADRYPILVIDTASKNTWTGYVESARTSQWETSSDEASQALFACLRTLDDRGIDWKSCQSIAYNEGPGSMLGIRTALMAIRTWLSSSVFPASSALYAYNSLAMASLLPDSQNAAAIVTDARRKTWNAYQPQKQKPEISLLDNDALESLDGEVRILAEFNQWTQTAANLLPLAYDPSIAFSQTDAALQLSRPVDVPTPLVLRESKYQKWVPRFATKETAAP